MMRQILAFVFSLLLLALAIVAAWAAGDASSGGQATALGAMAFLLAFAAIGITVTMLGETPPPKA